MTPARRCRALLVLIPLFGGPALAQAPPTAGGDDVNWYVSEVPTPGTGAPRMAAVLQSTQGTSALVIRCHEQSTDVYVTVPSFVGGAVQTLPVTYRINDGSPIETRWTPSREGNAVFVSSVTEAIAFVRSLPDDGTVAMTIRDYQSQPFELTLVLGPVGEVRDRLASACNWPTERVATAAPPAAGSSGPSSAAPSPRPNRKGRIVNVDPRQHRWNINVQRR